MSQIKKYLGVDWGEKRIGLAIADSETKLATPFGVVFSLEEVLKVVREEDVEEIVIGEPKSMSGGKRLAREFLEFTEKLKKNTHKKVIYIDERLSSKAADNLAGSKKEKAARDAVAAMIILQSHLDME